MKRLILLLIVVCNLSTYGQTKMETIDWLNSKFENSPIISTESEQYTRFLKIKQDGSFSIQSYEYSLKVILPDLKNYKPQLC